MPSKAALGPLTRIAEKGPRTVPLRGPAMPKSHSQTSDPRQNGACATAAHPADSPKRAVELPIRGYLIGGYSPAAGDYLTTSGEVASLQVNDSGNALFDGAGNYYSHDPISGMVDRINDSPIESVYPESYVGAIGVWRIGVGLGYRTIAAITAMGSPTYGTFAAGSVARTAWKAANLSFRWLRPNTLFVSPRFYWGKAGGDFGRAITSLGHPNGVVDRALIPLAPLATGFLSD